MTNSPSSFDCANAIRALSMDAVQQANSGHPGMPMGMADIAEVLWRRYMRYSPQNPGFYNRDRFVLSNGHGAMLLYSLLHLTGYDVSIDDLKNFRQLHSKTPGHPELSDTPGVETTTGPLGQGLANGVGMALAEKTLAAQFNKGDFNLVDHFTYVFAGDGCLMEGISHEACSLAGTFNLGKLIVFYDDNGISIDGEVDGWFTDDTVKRFEAYGWQVVADVDGHDAEQIEIAINKAQANLSQPTLICCKTQIGFGSPNKANTAGAHGAPLGDDEIKLARKQLGWVHEPFTIPEDIKHAWDHTIKGIEEEAIWSAMFAQYETQYPKLASEFLRRMQGHLPTNFSNDANAFIEDLQQTQKEMATRKASLVCIEEFAKHLPELVGGSADLSGSNCTNWKACVSLNKQADGNYIEYGVREFAMSAMMNGMALHGGFIPFGGTFLTFTDYARNAVRLSALMKQRVIYIYSHDSIGLGEDGPTHQPIEHAAMLRITPDLNVWRPADEVETAVAWNHALHLQGPSALLLTRQNLPPLSRSVAALKDVERGAYILFEPDRENIDAIIIATGSEVSLALDAAKKMQEKSFAVRVVSMPCADVFKQQDADYRELVLPKNVTKRLAIEAGVSDYWYQFVGLTGAVIGIDHFGASAPAEQLFSEYGFTVDNVVNTLMTLLSVPVEI